MKIIELIRWLRRNRQQKPDFRELRELSEKARFSAEAYNHEELTGMIRRYRESDDAIERIALAIAKSEPFHSPSSTMNRCSIEMMDALKNTGFMEKHGHRLSDITPEEASPVHRLFAMYTFMQESGPDKFPVDGMEQTRHDDIISAIRILDYHRKGQDISELCELSAYSMLPSKYVMMRYGLDRHCDAYRCINGHVTETDDSRSLLQAEADMCRAAESAVEGIDGVRLPDYYLEQLDRELDRLGRIAMSPDCVNDLIIIKPDLLIKYGIDRNASSEEISRQAQRAYCELDARFVKMTGRRPYAESLMASISRKTDSKVENSLSQKALGPRIRNPPPFNGKSRKPSF